MFRDAPARLSDRGNRSATEFGTRRTIGEHFQEICFVYRWIGTAVRKFYPSICGFENHPTPTPGD